MIREALAWWVREHAILEGLSECEKGLKEAKQRKQKGDRKIKPRKELSRCLDEKLPKYPGETPWESISCLTGLAWHLDACEWEKDRAVMEPYRNGVSNPESVFRKAVRKAAEDAQKVGGVPEVTRAQSAQFLPGSFFISFDFRLRKPYLSRDDTSFYVIDNPVRKDWVFKVPYIAPGQWKGCLHAAMARQLADWWASLSDEEHGKGEHGFIERRLQMARLFGNEQGVEVDDRECDAYLDRVGGQELAKRYLVELKTIAPEGHRRGRLMCYPTFFAQIGIEVINPHNRKTGAGRLPIYFETVPAGTSGRFALLYVPFDRAGTDSGETLKEMADDLCRVAEGIVYLLAEFGFGAKTSSGFGLAAADHPCAGELAVRLPRWGGQAVQKQRFESLRGDGNGGLVPKAREFTNTLAAGGGPGVL